MFSPYNEVLAQSRMDHLYDVEIPRAELRTRVQANAGPPVFIQPSVARRLGRLLLGSVQRRRAVAPREVIPAD